MLKFSSALAKAFVVRVLLVRRFLVHAPGSYQWTYRLLEDIVNSDTEQPLFYEAMGTETALNFRSRIPCSAW